MNEEYKPEVNNNTQEQKIDEIKIQEKKQEEKITEELKNEKQEIKRINSLLILLFLICLGTISYIAYDKLFKEDKSNNTNKINDIGNSNDNIVIEKTKTVTNTKDGTYIIDVSNVVDNVMPSIVAITSKSKIKSGSYGLYSDRTVTTGAGSGIIIKKTDKELMILTNYHVVEDADALSVKFINDKSVDATVLGKSKARDIAVITIKLSQLDESTLNSIKIATLGNSKKLKVGQGIIAIGNALGYGQSVTTGVISALDREVSIEETTNNMIQIDAAINGGNSGGALINSNGEVIGINSAKYSSKSTTSANVEGMGFAIPISDVEDLINKIINGQTLKDEERGYLGISGYMITEAYSEYYNIPKGIYIKSIYKGSAADKSELSVGNIIIEVDGTKVKNISSLNEILENKRSGEKLTLKIKYVDGRNYKEKNIEVVLSGYNEIAN